MRSFASKRDEAIARFHWFVDAALKAVFATSIWSDFRIDIVSLSSPMASGIKDNDKANIPINFRTTALFRSF